MAFLHLDAEVGTAQFHISAWALARDLLGWEGEVGFGASPTTKIHVAVPWQHSCSAVDPLPPEVLHGHCFHVPVLEVAWGWHSV